MSKIETVDVAERTDALGSWGVEAIDDDGGIELAIFAGPHAKERAHAHAADLYCWSPVRE